MNPTQSQVPNPQSLRITHHASRTSFLSYLASPYAALFLFLLSIYLLTYTPRISSSDGLAMFAEAESLVRRGALDIEQIRWMGYEQGVFGFDGLLYSRKGIGFPISVLPLIWLGLVVPWFGTISVSLVFNAIFTALTAVILLAYLQQLGFDQRTGLIVALTFGLATLAWPYAKSLFRDPFSGLLLLAAGYALLKMNRQVNFSPPAPVNKMALPRPPASWESLAKSLRYPFLAGLLLGWNVAVRYVEVLFLPIYGLLLIYYLYKNTSSEQIKNQNTSSPPRIIDYVLRFKSYHLLTIAVFCAPLLLIGLSLIALNLSRYGSPFSTGYYPGETFSNNLWDGVIGQLVSPGRGLLLYCPILILSLWGVAPFFRRFWAEASVAMGIIIIHLLLHGKWYMWHGGYAWGPRFMVPTLPFWVIFLAPIVARIFPAGNTKSKGVFHLSQRGEKLGGTTPHAPRPAALFDSFQTHPKSKILRIAFFVLVALSLIPQFLSVIIDFAPFQNSLLDTGLPLFARQTFFDPQYSAFVGAWAFITPDALDLAWAWQGRVNWWLLAMLVVNIAITGFYLARRQGGKETRRQEDKEADVFSITNYQSFRLAQLPITNLLPYLSTLITLIFLLIHAHTLPAKSLQDAVTALNETVRPTDAVITNGPELTMPFIELYKGRAPVLGLNNGGFPLPDYVTNRLNETIAGHSQVWWLPNWLPPEESAVEQILLAQGFRARSDNFDGQRLVLFAYPPNLAANTGFTKVDFDNLISLTEVAYPPNTAVGVAFPIELRWQAAAPLTQNYHVFIHLLNSEGQVVAQADGQPAQWRRPTSTWAVGERVVDRHGLWIPAETTPEEYQLLIGLYRPEDGQRLSLLNGEDSVRFAVRIE